MKKQYIIVALGAMLMASCADEFDRNFKVERPDKIEKYAYQYASGYELFVDRWETTSELLTYIPLERNELENMLRQQKQIEYSDSTKTYLLQVTKKYMRGEAMPIGYAQPEIEKIILSRRQVEFLQREREKIYQDAIREKKVIFF